MQNTGFREGMSFWPTVLSEPVWIYIYVCVYDVFVPFCWFCGAKAHALSTCILSFDGFHGPVRRKASDRDGLNNWGAYYIFSPRYVPKASPMFRAQTSGDIAVMVLQNVAVVQVAWVSGQGLEPWPSAAGDLNICFFSTSLLGKDISVFEVRPASARLYKQRDQRGWQAGQVTSAHLVWGRSSLYFPLGLELGWDWR